MSKWISVNERLPHELKLVICLEKPCEYCQKEWSEDYKEKHKDSSYYRGNVRLGELRPYWDKESRKWAKEWVVFKSSYRTPKVTHWMPFPEFPNDT